MYEVGLCEGLLDSVLKRANGRVVVRVRIRAGIRHSVDSQSMARAFRFVAQDSEAADATVDVVTIPAEVSCRRCGYAGTTTELLAVCPLCHRRDVEIIGGDEMILDSLEYAVQEDHS